MKKPLLPILMSFALAGCGSAPTTTGGTSDATTGGGGSTTTSGGTSGATTSGGTTGGSTGGTTSGSSTTTSGSTTNGGTTGGSTTGGTTGGSSTSGGSTTGTATPVVLGFGTNVSEVTVNESVRFVAVVTDPAGLDHLVGGRLTDETGAIQYGAFQATTQGSYQLDLSWSMMNQAQSINFTTEEKRSFTAEFFDLGGASITKKAELRLYCQDAGTVACDGKCADLATDLNNCGKCGRRITTGSCKNGVPTCSGGYTYCESAGVCSYMDTDNKNCGGCGIVCDFTQVCLSSKCRTKIDTNMLESCDTLCGGAGLSCFGTGTADYLFLNDFQTGVACGEVPAAKNGSGFDFVALHCTCS